MIKYSYLLRLDDACPTMNATKWSRIESILGQWDIKPMVGIIPCNKDTQQMIDSEDPQFWLKVRHWEEKGWAIALHGYDHCYISEKGKDGINPLWRRSEFAGVPIQIQRQKIHNGVKIMQSHGINPRYFFAPSHTFDENTLEALREESDIRCISDTIATTPYRYKDFIFIPQQCGHCINLRLPGTWTFCLHPSTMSEKNMKAVESFISKHAKRFASFNGLNLDKTENKNRFSRLLSSAYFTYRKIRDNTE